MSNASTIKYGSGAGVDWAALIAGLGLGLTVAMQVTTMTYSDISSPYAVVTSFSRLCALVGTYFAVLGIFLIARIPFVERGVGHDRLVTWHWLSCDLCYFRLCWTRSNSFVQRAVEHAHKVLLDVGGPWWICVDDLGGCDVV